MNGMERYEGTFYNWYDTQSVEAAGASLRLRGG
jgi:hypothetical protein